MKFFNAFHLKIIALLTMIIDHLGLLFFTENPMFRIVGRIAFILYAFMLVEGFFHTKDFKKYAGKLLLWALLSEIPFDIAIHGKWFHWEHQNIFWTLFLSLIGIHWLEKHKEMGLKILIGVFILFSTLVLRVDYGIYGVGMVFAFYFSKKYNGKLIFPLFASLFIGSFMSKIQFFALLGFLIIYFYNGKQGRKTGTIFYSFYAIQLGILGIIKYFYQ